MRVRYGICAAALSLALLQAPVVAQDAGAWRPLDPENTLYLQLESGRVVIELAPQFAPRHVENLRALTRGGMWAGGGVVRSQDNYVAQWQIRELVEGERLPEGAVAALPREFQRESEGLDFLALPDTDTYAPIAGFVDGFPVGLDPLAGRAWIAHCYGVVGVARGDDPDGASGTQLYAVTGHAPRHLDRNLTMVGRVVDGMEHLTTLPRGTEALGFYATDAEVAPILSAAMGSDLPPEERLAIEIQRTSTVEFRGAIAQQRSRSGAWWVHTAHRIELCNVRVPTRPAMP